MSWWGKIAGGAFGFAVGGPLGALLGAALGHQFDRGLEYTSIQGGLGAGADRERIQGAFFTALFSVMGHLAKADGHVSEDEIGMARAIMQQMHMNSQQQKVAINLFNKGKQPDFPLNDIIDQFRRECHRRTTLIQMFMEMLVQAAYADGVMHPNERRVLVYICERLGFSVHVFAQIESMVRAQHSFHGRGEATYDSPRTDQLPAAYAALGLKSSVSDAEVKKAYRRLMNQHHPDKLIAKGMPEEMVELATGKTQEIHAAYDRIKQAREM